MRGLTRREDRLCGDSLSFSERDDVGLCQPLERQGMEYSISDVQKVEAYRQQVFVP